MEKVTIIIPVYNGQNRIGRCLESVYNQNYSELEVIVIDDGSTDRTGEICREYQKKMPQMHVIETENKGVSSARNLGIQHASGTYIVFLDSDDLLEMDGIESLMEYREDGQWVIGNYMTNDLRIPKDRGLCFHEQYFPEEIHRGKKDELPQLCIFRNFYCVWGKLYSGEIIRRHKLSFDESRNYGEDILFNMDYFKYVDNFVILKRCVYYYCYQFGEGLGTRYIKDSWEIQKYICKKMQQMALKEYKLNEDTMKELNHFYYSQGIAALTRIAEEETLRISERRAEIKKITSSSFFRDILEKEYLYGRIRRIDRQLLKHQMGMLYYRIHRIYVMVKIKENGK